MKLNVSFYDMNMYMLVLVNGIWCLRDIKQLIRAVRTESERRERQRVLLDMSFVDSPPPELDRFLAGEYAAFIWRDRLKVAVLTNPDYINKFGENVAINRGADLRVLGDRQAALQWLLGQPSDELDRGFPR